MNFPILKQLHVSNYGLFPGQPDQPGLQVNFAEGLTLILGANGLGKTTLIYILYRLLTGAYDISGLDGRNVDLGNLSLEPGVISSPKKSMFAQRVFDNARDAKARLSLSVGQHEIVIERHLKDLKLLHFEIDRTLLTPDEKAFQQRILDLVEIGSFGDWILTLRYLLFYFEDRRALVWDASAQRQMLRFLFLPIDVANNWTSDERAILELDTRMRNLRAALYKEEQELSVSEEKLETQADVKKVLQTLEHEQNEHLERRQAIDDAITDLDAARQRARLRVLKAEQEGESSYRELERGKLLMIRAAFPSESDTAAYLYTQLFMEGKCLVCGNRPSATVLADYTARLSERHCMVCQSKLKGDSLNANAPGANQQIDVSSSKLEATRKELLEARSSLSEAENAYDSNVSELARLDTEIATRSERIDRLIQQLPPEEAKLRQQRSGISVLRGRVAELQELLESRRRSFDTFVQERNRQIANWADQIKTSFNRYAEDFLLETCQLVWAPQKGRLGQSGGPILFPAFELEMSSADFISPVRRSGPEQVSESQREFIDLAFRMALMEVAGDKHGTTLLIDTPESSLDAVFGKRAAAVLARFVSKSSGNRLIMASNLVEGSLVPALIQLCKTARAETAEIIDLFRIAAPTAAVRKLKQEYDDVQKHLLLEHN